MLRGVFNMFSSNDEERLVPYFIEKDHDRKPDDSWITSQVFRQKGWRNGKNRIYFAARKNPDSKDWDISMYSYPVKSEELQTLYRSRASTLKEAILKIMDYEKSSGLGPAIPGLEGNYRRVAHFSSSVYFDDQGNLVSADKGVSSTREAMLTRKKLDEIYREAESKVKTLEAPGISTWEDFYSKVVERHPLPEGTEVPGDIAKELRSFRHKWRKGSLSSPDTIRNVLSETRVFNAQDLEERVNKDVGYQYNALVLAMMMRTGAHLYDRFSSGAETTSQETIQAISEIGSAIKSFAQGGFGLTEEQGKQLADIIMQGPDPYADRPLPIETLIDAAVAPQKKPASKPHTP